MPLRKTPPQTAAAAPISKVRENRLRRMASRQGLVLEKSPRRDRLALDFGLWRVGRKAARGIVWEKGPRPGIYPATIDEIERRLTGGTATPRA
jgi:hypothetical protein